MTMNKELNSIGLNLVIEKSKFIISRIDVSCLSSEISI